MPGFPLICVSTTALATPTNPPPESWSVPQVALSSQLLACSLVTRLNVTCNCHRAVVANWGNLVEIAGSRPGDFPRPSWLRKLFRLEFLVEVSRAFDVARSCVGFQEAWKWKAKLLAKPQAWLGLALSCLVLTFGCLLKFPPKGVGIWNRKSSSFWPGQFLLGTRWPSMQKRPAPTPTPNGRRH